MFYYPTLYFLSFVDKLTFVERNSHTRPQENAFFGFETQNKTRRLEKNNSKQFLLRCCYTNFRLFARNVCPTTSHLGICAQNRDLRLNEQKCI